MHFPKAGFCVTRNARPRAPLCRLIAAWVFWASTVDGAFPVGIVVVWRTGWMRRSILP